MITAYRTAVGWLERFPDTPGFFSRHLASPWRQFVVLLLLGLILRGATFGDPNLHIDETFYFLVGQEMHRGAIPYVDIWDRKPIGLFLIYWAIAGISTSVVAYQIAAWLFASATAWVICLIARRWGGVQGGLLAGASYLFMLGPQEGYGGQSPVFYNLLIASAALLVLDARPELKRGEPTWRVFLAMALSGLALTVKQTSVFEAAFFGLVVLWYQTRSNKPKLRSAAIIIACAVIGALPTVTTGITYYLIGHWSEFWHAMVTSNLAKAKASIEDIAFRATILTLRLYPYLASAALGIKLDSEKNLSDEDKRFTLAWVLFSIFGVLSVPNFYAHYTLPMLVPLAALSGILFRRRDIGFFIFSFTAVFSVFLYNPFDIFERQKSIETFHRLVADVENHSNGRGLFIYEGPPYLYAMTNKEPLSALMFPGHLSHAIEKNVSQFNTTDEVYKIISKRPGVVIMGAFPMAYPPNYRTRAIVKAYAANNCQLVDAISVSDRAGTALYAVYGDCQDGAPDLLP